MIIFLVAVGSTSRLSPARPLSAIAASRRYAGLVGAVFREQRSERLRRQRFVARRRALLVVREKTRLADPLPQCFALDRKCGHFVEIGNEPQISAEGFAEPMP